MTGDDTDTQSTTTRPAARADESLWGSQAAAPPPAVATAAPAAPEGDAAVWGPPAPAPDPRARPARRWVGAVISTIVIGVAAVVGVHLTSSTTSGLAAGATGGGPGGPGGGGGFVGPGAGGTIASVNGASLIVTTGPGTSAKVVTSAATTVSVSSTGSPGDVAVGDNVTVLGARSGASVTALQIIDTRAVAAADGPGGAGAPGALTAGVVQAVHGSSFDVAATDGSTVSVATSSATGVTVARPGSVGDLKVGDAIRVTGPTAGDGTIAATSIRSGAEAGGPGQAGARAPAAGP